MIIVNFPPIGHLGDFSAVVPWWKDTGMGLNRSRCKILINGKVMEEMSDMVKWKRIWTKYLTINK